MKPMRCLAGYFVSCIKTVSTILIFILASSAGRAGEKNVLFIGNSITYFNDMPQVFRDIADQMGDSVNLTVYAPGGTGFQDHYINPDVFDLFRMGNWDVIVLQPGSNESVGVPPAQPRSTTLAQGKMMIDSALLYSPCARILFYEISYGIWGNTSADIAQYNATMNQIRTTAEYLSDSAGYSFAPVGEAFRYIWNTAPATSLWNTYGDIHPNIRGSYIASCVFYSSIFFKPSYGNTIYNGNTPEDAAYYQHIADSVVLGHLNNWRIDTLWHRANFDFTVSGNTVNTNGIVTDADSLMWIFEPGATGAGVHASYTFSSPGTYPVQMIAFWDDCRDTIIHDVIVTGATGIKDPKNDICLYFFPNPVINKVSIFIPAGITDYEIRLADISGKIMLRYTNRNIIEMAGLSAGAYIISLRDLKTGRCYRAKLLKQ